MRILNFYGVKDTEKKIDALAYKELRAKELMHMYERDSERYTKLACAS